MGRIITCTNEDGLALRFGYDYTPWLLTDVEGVYLSEANVYTSENTMIDGSTYQGTTLKMRNIVLTMIDRNKTGLKHNRQVLYDVFKPKSPGTLSYSESGETRSITYYVESVQTTSMGAQRTATVSLICPDPYFYGENDVDVLIAGWNKLFTFKHEFSAAGEELGAKSAEKLKVIANDTAADNIGMTITITADGDVTNPSITRVESQQVIKLGTDSRPLAIGVGDEIKITTGTGNKHVYLTRDDVKTEINSYLSEDSEFIQLMRGNNTIGYAADSGAEYLRVSVKFRYKFLGV